MLTLSFSGGLAYKKTAKPSTIFQKTNMFTLPFSDDLTFKNYREAIDNFQETFHSK